MRRCGQKRSDSHSPAVALVQIVQFLRGTETGWLQLKWGVVDEDYWAGYCETIRMIVGSEGGRHAFATHRSVFSESFAGWALSWIQLLFPALDDVVQGESLHDADPR